MIALTRAERKQAHLNPALSLQHSYPYDILPRSLQETSR